jgi:tetratricopeptide (TPR) repeat protein
MRDLNHIAYVRADWFYKRGRLFAAAKWFTVAVKEWPFDYQALWALGDTFSELKKPKKSLVFYTQAIKLAPVKDQPVLNYNLGNAFFDQGRYEQAIASYRKVSPKHEAASLAAKNIELSKRFLAKQPNPSFKRDWLKPAP